MIKNKGEKMEQAFEPVFDQNSKILILGSFPSVISRQVNFYYGNKRNKFWQIMEGFFCEKFSTIEQKKESLLKHNIAIWDIVQSCDIIGSMDGNIKNYKFADIKKILPPYSNINKILCNGKLAYKLTLQYTKLNKIDIQVVYLPSTSPANVRFNKNEWFKELKY